VLDYILLNYSIHSIATNVFVVTEKIT